MNNHDLSRFLQRTANLLKIQGANAFKVRAYERGAEAVAGHQDAMSDLSEAQRVEIDGIGKSISRDIQQVLDTGTSEVYGKLTEEIPESLLDLLRIQGMGPKKVAALWQALGVTDIAALRSVLASGQIEGLKGFGKKTRENLEQELDRLERMTGRTPIGQAFPVAQSILAHLEGIPGVDRVQACGSLRRRAETIGDLDFVAITTGPPEDVMDAFVEYPDTHDVLAKGSTKTSIRLHGGLQVDLRVVRPDQWGSAIHHFTGSKFHHIELRARAQKMGLKVSEYGVSRVDSGEVVASLTEEDVYAALGLAWVPPEMREGRGEVEAAANGTLPELVSLADIRGDLHMHTTASDGTASIVEMAEAARAKGYEYICITDHSPVVLVANGLDAERMRGHIDAIREADAAVDGIRIFTGIEVDILSAGDLDMEHQILEQLDYVVGSVHTAFSMNREKQTERMVRAIRSGLIHAVGHPTGRRLGKRDGIDLDFDAVVEAALDHEVALEINASPNRLDLKDTLARHARDAGVPIIISSDAHSIRGLDVMPYGVDMARRGWVRKSDVLNTLSAADFAARLGQ